MSGTQQETGSKFAKPAGADTPETPQESKLSKAFTAAGDRSRNIFFGMNAQAINEFHALIGHPNNNGRLTLQEKQLLADIRKEAQADYKRHGLPLAVLESLLLAQRVTGVDHDAYMVRVLGPQALNSEVSDTAVKAGPIKIDLYSWLYLVKNQGAGHGLGYFADKITAEPQADGSVALDVKDPAVLRQISALRDNPRIAAMMAAEQVKHSGDIPKITYKGATFEHDEEVARNQRNLKTLGYDIGLRGADGIRGPFTDAAEEEFAKLCKPPVFSAKALQEAADQAVRDSADFRKRLKVEVSPDQAFAIRQASKVGGADFDLMMKLVKRESNFESDVTAKSKEAESKKAVGLFQFKPATWLAMVKRYGDDYGIGELAEHIKVERTRSGTTYTVQNPWIREHILGLRKDPRISAMMGAEFLKENRQILQNALREKPGATEQYMAHFLGPGGAVDFLTKMKNNGGQSAPAAFPKQAEHNKGVFYNRDGSPRTLREVYQHIAATFDTESYAGGKKPKAPARRPLHHR
jgi:hypothetical protein